MPALLIFTIFKKHTHRFEPELKNSLSKSKSCSYVCLKTLFKNKLMALQRDDLTLNVSGRLPSQPGVSVTRLVFKGTHRRLIPRLEIEIAIILSKTMLNPFQSWTEKPNMQSIMQPSLRGIRATKAKLTPQIYTTKAWTDWKINLATDQQIHNLKSADSITVVRLWSASICKTCLYDL